MARSITEIQQSIIATKAADATLAGLSSSSNAAIWLLWTYIVAVCQWTLEQLFDAHKSEVSTILATQKPHTLQWYVTKARQYQHGYSLAADSDTYATLTDDPAVRIVPYAAATELTNLVRIKAATLSGGVLSPLSVGELTAFTAYMQQIKDAGVRLQVTSNSADTLRLSLKVFYDPLVLDANGARLDGAATNPVKVAVNAFLANLPFNGLFVVNRLIAVVQQVEGVLIAQILGTSATYAALPYTTVVVEYLPDAGYMVLDDSWFDANVVYASHGVI